MDPEALRMSLAAQSQILRDWGRFNDAVAVLRRYEEGRQLIIPAQERRAQAVCALGMARIEAEGGRPQDAWAHIKEAISILANDAVLGLKCESAKSWVLASGGLADDSRRVAAQAQARLTEFEGDMSTCRGVMYDLGMAACKRGDHEEGEHCWSRYLELSPDPVYRPTAYYFRGECRFQRGNSSDAKADFRAAVAFDIDTHYARLARRRLVEMPL
jgi:tetratricopeptide (TPR) repeat protein